MVKGSRNSTKQTVQFKYEDVTFFCKNDRGKLCWLPCNAADSLIATTNRATLKLDNQKNAWKAICVYHEANGNDTYCPIRALGRRLLHLQHHGATAKTFLSAYFNEAGQRFDITNQDISAALKLAATFLGFPTTKGIPINHIDTHLLRSGGENALLLAGYSDTQIQKMGRWHRATFKGYIQEELACFFEGMSCSMKQKLRFANVAGNSFNTITDDLISTDYNVNVSTE
jgi:hypothetical protein